MRHHLAGWASRRLLGRPVLRGSMLRTALVRASDVASAGGAWLRQRPALARLRQRPALAWLVRRPIVVGALRRPAIAGPVVLAVLGASALVTWQVSTRPTDALAVGGGVTASPGAPTRIAFSSDSQSRIGHVVQHPNDPDTVDNLDEFWDEQADAQGERTAFVSHRPRHDGQPEPDGEIWYMAKGTGDPSYRPPAAIPLTDDNAPDAEPALSPDGKWVAYASLQDGNWDIWVVAVSGAGAHRVTTGPADDRWPTWSPDSTKLAFSSNRDDPAGEIYSVLLSGAAPTRLTNNPGGDTEPAWAPTSNRIAFTTTRSHPDGDIVIMPAGGGALTTVVSGREAAWSPDETTIAYTSFDVDPKGDVYTVTLAGGWTQYVSMQWDRTERHPTWHATRGWMFTVGDVAVRFEDVDTDVWSVRSDGTDPSNVTVSYPNRQQEPTFSPDGKRIAYSESDHGDVSSIVVADADGSHPQVRITSLDFHTTFGDPAWSPDGKSIAFNLDTSFTTDGGTKLVLRSEIAIMDAETGADGSTGAGLQHVPCVVKRVCYDREPAWSPDSKRLAFTRGYQANGDYGMNSTLYVADADSTGPFHHQFDLGDAVYQTPVVDHAPGEEFRSYDDQGPDWMPADPAQPDTWRIVFARDGIWLLTTSPDVAKLTPSVVLSPSMTLSRVRDPAYSPDGAAIAFAGFAGSAHGVFAGVAGAGIFTMASGGPPYTKIYSEWGDDDHPVYQPAANLTTTIAAAPPGVRLNQATVATVTVANSGPSTAPNASVALTLAAGLRVDRLTPSTGTCDATTLKCSFGTMALGAKVTIKVDLTGTATGGHLVTAAATSDRFEYDPKDNNATTTITVDSADVAVKVSVTPVPGYVGGSPIVVTYLVTNEGTSAATGVHFVATLPAELPMVGAPGVTLVPTGPPPPACPTPTAGCDLGTLVPGQVVTITVTLAPNTAVNTAAIGAVTGIRLTGDPSDDTASTPLIVLAPQVKVDPKSGQPNFLPVVTGTNFPPGTQIRLAWSRGIQPDRPFTVAADGTFTAPLIVFPTDHLYGLRQVVATPWTGTQFGAVQAPYVLDPGRNTPDDFVVRR